MPTNPGKSFPSVDITHNWHAPKAMVINNLLFGIWLEITISTTQSAKRSKEQEQALNKNDNGERIADCRPWGGGFLTVIVITSTYLLGRRVLYRG
jgi:hypothetical protein